MDWEKQETMRLLQGRPGTVYQESSDEEKKKYREWLKNILHTGVTTVTFVKADGSLRDMKATLDPAHIPQFPILNEARQEKIGKVENNDVCKVWDTEAGAWRSFRYDRIKTISISLG